MRSVLLLFFCLELVYIRLVRTGSGDIERVFVVVGLLISLDFLLSSIGDEI
jgi:hypothetical protein